MNHFKTWNQAVVWYSGVPSTLGVVLAAADLAFLFRASASVRGRKRWNRSPTGMLLLRSLPITMKKVLGPPLRISAITQWFKRVIVVDNNSRDKTAEFARAAGAIVVREMKPGYGNCVYRCYQEALAEPDAELIVVCEGDMTFRAGDLEKFLAYIDHAEIVNGTRIVEQLREYSTQLSTFMYYGNFFRRKNA